MPPRTVHLRSWQKAALDAFAACPRRDFLAVATPGAGKTTFALTAVVRDLLEHPWRRVAIVVPTQQLKHQWTRAAAQLDLHLEPTWAARDGQLPADMHGVVVTYQQVAVQAPALRALARDAFVVFDELHHAGEDRAWGDGIRIAFELAARRLALSGTPFRSDTVAIPFVDYDADSEARADFEYGYGEALRDGGVVRPVYFPRLDGQMEWVAPDGTEHSASFADALDAVRSAQRLRTALSLEGEWLPTVLQQAHAQLLALRATQPQAAGLVIAIDHDHARGIVEILRRRCGTDATLVLSDDPGAAGRIAAFAQGTTPWIVAVRMVSEGVDIPRLRVGVYATTTTTELFFRQATGRLVRWLRGLRSQRAYMFIPDEPRLRRYAAEIAQQRRHSLRRRDDDPDDPRAGEDVDAVPAEGDRGDQLSLFMALSAVAVGAAHLPEADDATDVVEPEPEQAFVLQLAAPPRPGASGAAVDDAEGAAGSRREHKGALRAANAARAATIVRLTGLSHAQVNSELNRLSGVRRVSEATVDQLRRRLDRADRWVQQL